MARPNGCSATRNKKRLANRSRSSFPTTAVTKLHDILELYEGIAETGVPVVGGDLSRAEEVILSVTALGRSARVPGRAGARPGDDVVVTGRLGAAGAAFRRQSYVRPPIRLADGKATYNVCRVSGR